MPARRIIQKGWFELLVSFMDGKEVVLRTFSSKSEADGFMARYKPVDLYPGRRYVLNVRQVPAKTEIV